MSSRGFARGRSAALELFPAVVKSSSLSDLRAFLWRTASLLAIAAGTTALAVGAHAAGLDIGPGQTHNVVGTEVYDYLNIAPTGTLNLGNVNGTALIANDNGVDTTWSGFVTALNDNEFLAKTGNGTAMLLNLTSTGGEIHVDGGIVQQTSGTNQIWIIAVGSNIPSASTGTFNISGGTLNIKAGPASPFPAFQVGHFGGTGFVNQTAGDVNIITAAFNIGNQGGTGTYNLIGGAITVTGGSGVTIGRSTAPTRNSVGTLNISGGLFDDQQGDFVIGNNSSGGAASTSNGTINQTGGTQRIGSAANLYIAGYNAGTYNLNGGTLEIGGSSLHSVYLGAGTPTFNLGGGTIKVIDATLTTGVNATLVAGTTSTINTNNWGATWNGALSGSGNLNKTGGAALTFAGAPKLYSGSTTVTQGTLTLAAGSGIPNTSGVNLAASGASLDITPGSQTINNLSGVGGTDVLLGSSVMTEVSTVDTTFAGVISNIGGSNGIIKSGPNTLTLAGVSTYAGITLVQGGTLKMGVANAIAQTTGLTVNSGATFDLGGVGSQKIRTVINLNAGSNLNVNLGAQDRFDDSTISTTVNVNGVVHLFGGIGGFDPTAHYDLARTTGTVNVAGSTTTDDLVFLDASNPIADNASAIHTAYVTFTKNATTFAGSGVTPNEQAVGGALDQMMLGDNGLYDYIATLSLPDAQNALQQIAGDFHASTMDVLAQAAGYLADAALDRLTDALGSNGGSGADPAAAAAGAGSLWVQGYGHAVSIDDSSGNAGDVSGNHYGVVGGVDGGSGNWVLGAAGGYSTGSFDSSSRSSTADVSSLSAMVYGGGDAGMLRVDAGASYSLNQIDTTRTVLGDTLTASYDAHTAQVFGEVGARMGGFEPLAGASYINVATDAFAETGGMAAVSAAAGNDGVAFTTLGVRLATDDSAAGSFHGMAGWRHAFGDTTPLSDLTIQGKGYTVGGVPIAADAFVAEVGFDMNFSPTFTLGASYAGQISADAQDHGGKGTATVRF